MMGIINILISGLAVFITAYILPGVKVNSFFTALIIAVVLGVVNTFVKPILLIFTLPLNILTLGLFTFILNGLLILLTTRIVPGFTVSNIWWAILFSLVMWVVNSVLHGLTK